MRQLRQLRQLRQGVVVDDPHVALFTRQARHPPSRAGRVLAALVLGVARLQEVGAGGSDTAGVLACGGGRAGGRAVHSGAILL